MVDVGDIHHPKAVRFYIHWPAIAKEQRRRTRPLSTIGVLCVLNVVYVALEPADAQSRGRLLQLSQGLQLQADVYDYISPGFSNWTTWASANFTTINYAGDVATDLQEAMPAKQQWGAGSVSHRHGRFESVEARYVSTLTGLEIDLETATWNSTTYNTVATAYTLWHTDYPNVMGYSIWGGAQESTSTINLS